ncbi:MAG: hypothetical protein KC729_13270 [Candidatus Eisenbacteria bacterium]|uniref:Uncharacterized protein n=1 Tax=Eiseniibacteriota bacterium TaxID=2212470 RepID=A0A956RPW8_UNCEI|nr:hypothetical protein [Candidatus Eisenbacteria bacterium]
MTRLLVEAHRIGWSSPADSLVTRVVESWLPGACPEPPAAPQALRQCGAIADIRSGAPALHPGTEVYGSFSHGELACLVDPGSVAGAWHVRGTVWLDDPEGTARMEWLTEDHLLATIPLASGRPFSLEEIAGENWDLQLVLDDGSAVLVRSSRS